MFRVLVGALLVVITCSAVHSILIHSVHGDRIEGDIALYSRTQITTPTAQPTIHGVVFDWVGLNETFTQVLFEINGYSSLSFSDRREMLPPYLHTIVGSIIDIETHSLFVTMTVYGFSGKTHLDVHHFPAYNRISMQPIVNIVTTRN